MSTARVAVGGFLHESNSFSGRVVGYAHFVERRDGPPLVRGADVLAALDTDGYALAGYLCDPQAAAAAHQAGVGARFDGALGGGSGPAGVVSLTGVFDVVALGDGRMRSTGRMLGDTVLVVLAPGNYRADPRTDPYQRLRADVRRMPRLQAA